MRVTLGSAAAVALTVLALAGCGKAGPSQAEAASQPQTVTVHAVGCPTPGPQAGCLTMKSKGTIYDVTSANPAIDMSRGVGISLTGQSAGETTACGAKLSAVTVEYLNLQCGTPAPAVPAQ